jgi:hypothetical protein
VRESLASTIFGASREVDVHERADDRERSAPGASRAPRSEAVVVAPVPRVALTREEAAASLGMKLDSFERYVQPHVRMIRWGRLRLVPVTELERLASEAAERTLP